MAPAPVASSIFFPFIKGEILPFDSVIDCASEHCGTPVKLLSRSEQKKAEEEAIIFDVILSWPFTEALYLPVNHFPPSLFFLAFIEFQA